MIKVRAHATKAKCKANFDKASTCKLYMGIEKSMQLLESVTLYVFHHAYGKNRTPPMMKTEHDAIAQSGNGCT
jgi:hypothetical protein